MRCESCFYIDISITYWFASLFRLARQSLFFLHFFVFSDPLAKRVRTLFCVTDFVA